jgi:hypothetical protein
MVSGFGFPRTGENRMIPEKTATGVIDCHTHIFPPDFIRERERLVRVCPWFGTLYENPKRKMAPADALLASMKRAGVDRSVVFGFPWSDAGRLRAANDYTFDAAAKSAGRLLPFAVVDPGNMDLTEEEIVRMHGRGLRGMGELMPDGQGFRLDDERVMHGVMRLAAFHRLVVMIHTSEPVGHDYPGKGKVTPEVICRVAQKFPEVRMICAHWGGGLMAYEMMPEVTTLLKNVYYDSAASTLLYDDRAFQAAALLAPKKILFATDFPLIAQQRLLDRARSALEANPSLDDFLGHNAERLFADK